MRTFITRHLPILSLLILLSRPALAQAPVSITVLPNTITAGSGSTAIVALSAPAKSAVNLAVSSNHSSTVTVPAQVTVNAGSQYAQFAVTTQTSTKTVTVVLTATGGGGSAVGFFLMQAPASTPLPAYAGLTFSPTIAFSGQKITGTIAFTEPLVLSLTFDLASKTANFSVPSSVKAAAGAKSVSFAVTAGAQATTGAVQITAALAPGAYQNVWTGPTSTSGSFAFLAGTGLPPNYAAGFWVAPLLTVDSDSFLLPTLKTYPDGQCCFGGPLFDHYQKGAGEQWEYGDPASYSALARVDSNGRLELTYDKAAPFYGVDFFYLFPQPGAGIYTNPPIYIYDGSTLSFSADGKTATLTVSVLGYTWTNSSTPAIVVGNTVTLGTYTFTRVQ